MEASVTRIPYDISAALDASVLRWMKAKRREVQNVACLECFAIYTCFCPRPKP